MEPNPIPPEVMAGVMVGLMIVRAIAYLKARDGLAIVPVPAWMIMLALYIFRTFVYVPLTVMAYYGRTGVLLIAFSEALAIGLRVLAYDSAKHQ